MPKLTINGIEIEVDKGTSVLQACEQLGIEVPRFCYHDRLSVPANCRMCLVEQEGAPKPVASCALMAADGMKILTDSDKTRKARRGVMEFLLINHPLDCPICDQGGECDLQDQAMAYGFDRSRFAENKRAVTDKYMGPLIKTIMTRCIHCTRCVRFADEIAGVPDLGLLGRGEHVEIGTYVEKAVASELSGNLVDVCPVGALTSKPYAFISRPWEIKKTDSIDVLDAVGSNIRVDSRGGTVLRILPRLHEEVNEEWLADKSRYACDGLTRRRLDRPYIRRDGRRMAAEWPEALAAVAARLKGRDPQRVAVVVGDFVDCEGLFALRTVLDGLDITQRECRQDGAVFDPTWRPGYLFNSTISGIERADAVLLIGANPRHDAPLVNARLRKRWLASGLPVASVGMPFASTFPVEVLGAGPRALDDLGSFCATLERAAAPMLVLGMGALRRPDGLAIQQQVAALARRHGVVREGWNGLNMLHTAAARVGALDLGFAPGPGGRDLRAVEAAVRAGEIDTVILYGADELDRGALPGAFVVYVGHHGDAGASMADVILPSAAYTEKAGTYVNLEGRVQRTHQAVFPPGTAREDWRIFRALADLLGIAAPFSTLDELMRSMAAAVPIMAEVDRPASSWVEAPWSETAPVAEDAPFCLAVPNYYQTDPISRASPTMAACVAEFLVPAETRTGTDG